MANSKKNAKKQRIIEQQAFILRLMMVSSTKKIKVFLATLLKILIKSILL